MCCSTKNKDKIQIRVAFNKEKASIPEVRASISDVFSKINSIEDLKLLAKTASRQQRPQAAIKREHPSV